MLSQFLSLIISGLEFPSGRSSWVFFLRSSTVDHLQPHWTKNAKDLFKSFQNFESA